MTKQNKLTVFILTLLIVPLLSYLYFVIGLDLDKFLNYLKIPGIIIGVLLLVALNMPSIQKRMQESSGNNAQKRLLFLDQDETEIFSGRSTIFRLALGVIPTFYFFSQIIVTNKRIKFTLFPFLSMPAWSLFYQKTEKGFPYTPQIISATRGKNTLKISTSDNESIWIFIKNEEVLSKIESAVSRGINTSTT